jgi:hypothetical protein
LHSLHVRTCVCVSVLRVSDYFKRIKNKRIDFLPSKFDLRRQVVNVSRKNRITGRAPEEEEKKLFVYLWTVFDCRQCPVPFFLFYVFVSCRDCVRPRESIFRRINLKKWRSDSLMRFPASLTPRWGVMKTSGSVNLSNCLVLSATTLFYSQATLATRSFTSPLYPETKQIDGHRKMTGM